MSCIMFILAKNLVTNRIRITDSSKVYVLNTDRYEYSEFRPKSADDFIKKQHYGEIINDDMIYHYILGMSESEDEIQSMFSDPRKYGIHNPKRISLGEAFAPAVKFKLMQEKKDAASKKKSTKPCGSVDSKIIAKFASKSHTVDVSKCAGTTTSDDVPRTCNSCDILKKEIARLSEEKRTLECTIKDLEAKNFDLTDKLQFSVESLAISQRNNALLKDSLGKEVAELKLVKEEFKSLKDALSAQQQPCKLSSIKSAFIEEENGNGDPASAVASGSNITFKKSDVANVELKSFKVSARIAGLCELLWPNRVHEMSLSADPGTPNDCVIQKTHVKAIVEVLNAMDWRESDLLQAYRRAYPKREITTKDINLEPFNDTIVRCYLRQTTYNAKETHVKKAGGDVEEKTSRKQKKKKADKKKTDKKDTDKKTATSGTNQESQESSLPVRRQEKEAKKRKETSEDDDSESKASTSPVGKKFKADKKLFQIEKPIPSTSPDTMPVNAHEDEASAEDGQQSGISEDDSYDGAGAKEYDILVDESESDQSFVKESPVKSVK